ncbi:NAD(P)H-dependent oxidoreductase [Bifidobacterium simiarum]|uniref:General stress protein n=1 Tax=Bifidobacterium simiarum TaxID=2045441 RepID=A0A2M9HDT9_9BIFI|nr:NAD(P)H-dependent oxidoreductase [Bifidobacterium simiarum]PJM74983.1 general stress protein [Bifidobacterium simiarum]
MSTLVLVFHPHLEDASRINRRLVEEARRHAETITVVDEYAAYPDFHVDKDHEQQLVDAADRLVFEFPFYWYSAPALLKQWEDAVLTSDWAYGNAHALAGKEIQVVTTTGSPADTYTPEGRHHHTMDELLSPFETMADHIQATWVKPFVVSGVADLTDADLDRIAADYVKAITA